MSVVEVELLGIARFLARRELVLLPLDEPLPLPLFLKRLAEALPPLTGTVITADGKLLGGYVLARPGLEILRDPRALISPGERLMLLSLAAGG